MIYLGLLVYVIVGFIFHEEEQSGALNNLMLPGAIVAFCCIFIFLSVSEDCSEIATAFKKLVG